MGRELRVCLVCVRVRDDRNVKFTPWERGLEDHLLRALGVGGGGGG